MALYCALTLRCGTRISLVLAYSDWETAYRHSLRHDADEEPTQQLHTTANTSQAVSGTVIEELDDETEYETQVSTLKHKRKQQTNETGESQNAQQVHVNTSEHSAVLDALQYILSSKFDDMFASLWPYLFNVLLHVCSSCCTIIVCSVQQRMIQFPSNNNHPPH